MRFLYNAYIYVMQQEWSSIRLKEAKWLLIIVYIVLFVTPIAGLILTISLVESEKPTRIRYHNFKDSSGVGKNSSTILELPTQLSAGEYTVYYTFDNFYQNNRSFYWSYSNDQLLHKDIENTGNCGEYSKLGPQMIYPCGEIANKFFNDTIDIDYERSDDVWESIPITFPDFDSSLFKDYVINFSHEEIRDKNVYRLMQRKGLSATELPMPQNLLFLEWMRPNITHTVFKRYGYVKINQTLRTGHKIKIKYKNNFELNEGDKFIVFVPKGYSLVDKKVAIAIQSAAAALIIFMFLSTILGFNEDMFKPKTQKYTDAQFDFY